MSKIENQNVRVIPLGGAGEVGKNMYVIEIDDEMFIVDAGLKFPETEMFGIDMVIPDITYIEENADRVKAIFISHGHEDHIGSLGYVLRKINVPIYATKLTIGLIKQLLIQSNLNIKEFDFRTINPDGRVRFNNTAVTFFRTAHNIPDSVGICFQTSLGAVVYTSDFKFDPSLGEGRTTDISKITQIGNHKVLCMLSDSTNAERPGFTPSESTVGQSIIDEVYKAEGRVIVLTFATNIHRVSQVVQAAVKNNRKLIVVGKVMQKTVEIAQQFGYLEIPKGSTASVSEMDKLPNESVLILTSGVQGEPISALTRIAKGAHKQIQVQNKDTVIVSATPVPGNEINVYRAIDQIYRAGGKVLYNKANVHVSGHGSQEELKLMIQLLKPSNFVPVHGEYRNQLAHAKLAKQVGLENDNIHILDNGNVLHFTANGLKTAPKVPTGNILIDGLGVGDIGNIVLRDRRLLSQDGILVVVITLNKSSKKLVGRPEIISRGFIYVRESEQLIEESTILVKELLERSIESEFVDWTFLKSNVRDSLNSFLYEKTKRRPMIMPIVMEV